MLDVQVVDVDPDDDGVWPTQGSLGVGRLGLLLQG